MNIIEAANYLVFLSNQPGEKPITHLKLQKLLYLAQGWSYYWDDKPLFEDEFEAWTYGPVNIEVYQQFKEFGRSPIPFNGVKRWNMDAEEQDILEAVWAKYRSYSPSRLVEITHRHAPWREAFESDRIISNKAIKEFFQSHY